MSNLRLRTLLFAGLALFVGLAVRDLANGPYGGFDVVFWGWPLVFLLSLIVAILFGLRRPDRH